MSRSRRVAGFAGCFAVLALLLHAPVQAQTRPFVSISPTTSSVNPGSNVTVTLGYGRAVGPSPPTIYQLTGSVSWNASALTLVSAVPLGSADFRSCAILTGQLNFDFAENSCSTAVPFPNGGLCQLTFTAATTQSTRAAQALNITLNSCNDAVRLIVCKDGRPVEIPKTERVCDRINGSITVNQALYTSTPAPGARIELAAPIGGSASAMLQVDNTGSFATPIDFNGQAAPVSLLPDTFTLAAQGTQTVAVRCQPTAPGTVEQTVTTAVSHDPDRASASYTVACRTILPPERDVQGLTLAGDGDSIAPVFDASGRYVVFESRAGGLPNTTPPEGNDAGGSDIFRLDTTTGAIVRVSVDNLGAKMTGSAIEPDVAADGMAVAFVAPEGAAKVLRGESKAERERRLKGSGHAILLRNILTGTTQRIGNAVIDGAGSNPVIAPGSTAIAYTATNDGTVEGIAGLDQVYVVPLTRQLDGNLNPGTPVCVSCLARDEAGTPITSTTGNSSAPAISADGTLVVFETRAKNLLASTPSPCPTAASEIILRNILTGVTRRISPPPGTAPGACGLAGSSKPSIDFSGRMIAFESDQGINTGNSAGTPNVYVADAANASFLRMSETPDGNAGSAAARQPAISGDGRSVAFISAAPELDDSLGATDGRAYLHARRIEDILAQRLSLSVLGVQANAEMRRPALSYNGSKVAFDSVASNLVLDDTNGFADVFQRPLPVNADAMFYSSFE